MWRVGFFVSQLPSTWHVSVVRDNDCRLFGSVVIRAHREGENEFGKNMIC